MFFKSIFFNIFILFCASIWSMKVTFILNFTFRNQSALKKDSEPMSASICNFTYVDFGKVKKSLGNITPYTQLPSLPDFQENFWIFVFSHYFWPEDEIFSIFRFSIFSIFSHVKNQSRIRKIFNQEKSIKKSNFKNYMQKPRFNQ